MSAYIAFYVGRAGNFVLHRVSTLRVSKSHEFIADLVVSTVCGLESEIQEYRSQILLHFVEPHHDTKCPECFP